MIDYCCSHCGEPMSSPESLRGEKETCPTCGTLVRAQEPSVDQTSVMPFTWRKGIVLAGVVVVALLAILLWPEGSTETTQTKSEQNSAQPTIAKPPIKSRPTCRSQGRPPFCAYTMPKSHDFPKWDRRDKTSIAEPIHRRKALRVISDPDVLQRIAETDKYESVRISAIRKLTDPTRLANIAKRCTGKIAQEAEDQITDPVIVEQLGIWIDPEQTKQVTDTMLLCEIAYMAGNPEVRLTALASIQDQQRLEQIAVWSPYEDTRRAAGARLTNKEAFVKEAFDLGNADAQTEAVALVSDPAQLEEIAQTASAAATRCAAVKKVDNQAVLQKVALEDEDETVKAHATLRLTDQALLKQIAEETSSREVGYAAGVALARRTAFANIGAFTKQVATDTQRTRPPEFVFQMIQELPDQRDLGRIASSTRNRDLRDEALKRVTDEQQLTTMAIESKHGGLPEAILKKLTDPKCLASIALNAKSPYARKYAIEKVTDQTVLSEAAMKEKYGPTRYASIKRLTDQKTLLALYKRASKSYSVRRPIIERMTDNDSLEYVMINDPHRALKQLAASQITDPEVAARIAVQSKDTYVREVLIKTISDQKVLTDIVVHAPNKNHRALAIRRIDTPDAAAAVFSRATYSKDRRRLASIITFQPLLKELVANDRDQSVREAAFKNITEQATLAQIALEGNSSWRPIAASKLTDPVTMDRVFRTSKNRSVRREIVLNMDNQAVLKKLMMEEKEDARIRSAAASRVTDEKFLMDFILPKPKPSSTTTPVGKPLLKRDEIETAKGALERLSQDNLLRVYRESDSESLARAAVLHITDQAVLLEIFAELAPKDRSVADSTVRSIMDKLEPSVLASLETKHLSSKIRTDAAYRIKDAEALARIVREEPEESIRKIALNRIEDQSVLADLAEKSKRPYTRQLALQRVKNNEPLFLKLALHDPNEKIRLYAAGRVKDPSSRTILVTQSKDREIQLLAAKYMSEQDVIESIVKTSKDNELRRILVSRPLRSSPVLARIALHDKDEEVRLAAIRSRHLSSQVVLAQIALEDKNSALRHAATLRLKSPSLLAKVLEKVNKNPVWKSIDTVEFTLEGRDYRLTSDPRFRITPIVNTVLEFASLKAPSKDQKPCWVTFAVWPGTEEKLPRYSRLRCCIIANGQVHYYTAGEPRSTGGGIPKGSVRVTRSSDLKDYTGKGYLYVFLSIRRTSKSSLGTVLSNVVRIPVEFK